MSAIHVQLRVSSQKLRVERGTAAHAVVSNGVRNYLIGSSDQAFLMCHVPGLSPRHCIVQVSNRRVTVHDLEGHGTVAVNGDPVRVRRSLRNGDKLRVGPLELIVEIEGKVEDEIESHAPDQTETEITDWLMQLDEVERARRKSSPELRKFEAPPTPPPPTEAEDAKAAGSSKLIAPKGGKPKKMARPPTKPKSTDSTNAADTALKKLGFKRDNVVRDDK